LTSDEAYEAVFALSGAGIDCAVIDVRESSLAAGRARALGVEVQGGAVIEGAYGRDGVRTVRVVDVTGRARRELAADCLLMSGGHSPATTLASQLGARLTWQEAIAAFTADLPAALGQMAGAARGVFGLAAAARDGERAARTLAAQLARPVGAADPGVDLPPDADVTPIAALWEVGSEEHTSELQSLRHLVCRLLLEKKKHAGSQT